MRFPRVFRKDNFYFNRNYVENSFVLIRNVKNNKLRHKMYEMYPECCKLSSDQLTISLVHIHMHKSFSVALMYNNFHYGISLARSIEKYKE